MAEQIFSRGDQVKSVEALCGGCLSLTNCVRGVFVSASANTMWLRRLQIYLPGVGWYPYDPPDCEVEVNLLHNKFESTTYELF